MRRTALALLLALVACGGGGTASPDLALVNKAAPCASTFGTALTAGFGRLDGTVLAVVPPDTQQCAMPNGTHLVLQVSSGGAAYRMVVNVASDRGTDLRVRFAEKPLTLPGAAFSEGWHLGETFDYVTTLGVHTPDFTATDATALVAAITDRLTLSQPVSVYATTSGGASTHLVHRNATNQDGAIIIDPTGASPKALLLHFADQSF